jgi:hypothetical protein
MWKHDVCMDPTVAVPVWLSSDRFRIEALEKYATFGASQLSKLNALGDLGRRQCPGINAGRTAIIGRFGRGVPTEKNLPST